MFNLNPKEDKFYKLFKQQAQNTLDAAELLRKFLNNMENAVVHSQEIQKLEHEGDKIVHKIIEELNNAFVTPIDREDIYAVAKKMDDIIDHIESLLHSFIMLNVKECTDEARIFADFIVSATKEINELMQILAYMHKAHENKIINEKIIAINKIENEADVFFREVVGKLFREENIDVLNVIKWKDLYKAFENTIDSCETVANIIGGVVMKHA